MNDDWNIPSPPQQPPMPQQPATPPLPDTDSFVPGGTAPQYQNAPQQPAAPPPAAPQQPYYVQPPVPPQQTYVPYQPPVYVTPPVYSQTPAKPWKRHGGGLFGSGYSVDHLLLRMVYFGRDGHCRPHPGHSRQTEGQLPEWQRQGLFSMSSACCWPSS